MLRHIISKIPGSVRCPSDLWMRTYSPARNSCRVSRIDARHIETPAKGRSHSMPEPQTIIQSERPRTSEGPQQQASPCWKKDEETCLGCTSWLNRHVPERRMSSTRAYIEPRRSSDEDPTQKGAYAELDSSNEYNHEATATYELEGATPRDRTSIQMNFDQFKETYDRAVFESETLKYLQPCNQLPFGATHTHHPQLISTKTKSMRVPRATQRPTIGADEEMVRSYSTSTALEKSPDYLEVSDITSVTDQTATRPSDSRFKKTVNEIGTNVICNVKNIELEPYVSQWRQSTELPSINPPKFLSSLEKLAYAGGSKQDEAQQKMHRYDKTILTPSRSYSEKLKSKGTSDCSSTISESALPETNLIIDKTFVSIPDIKKIPEEDRHLSPKTWKKALSEEDSTKKDQEYRPIITKLFPKRSNSKPTAMPERTTSQKARPVIAATKPLKTPVRVVHRKSNSTATAQGSYSVANVEENPESPAKEYRRLTAKTIRSKAATVTAGLKKRKVLTPVDMKRHTAMRSRKSVGDALQAMNIKQILDEHDDFHTDLRTLPLLQQLPVQEGETPLKSIKFPSSKIRKNKLDVNTILTKISAFEKNAPSSVSMQASVRRLSTTPALQADWEYSEIDKCNLRPKKERRPCLKESICQKKILPGCAQVPPPSSCKKTRRLNCCEKVETPYPCFSEQMCEEIEPFYEHARWTCDRKEYGFHPRYKRLNEAIDKIRNKKP